MSRISAALVAFALAGCNVLGPSGSQVERLADARERWRSVGPQDYTYVLERVCFCGIEATGPARVTVRNAVEVVAVVYVESGEPVPDPFDNWFLSVEGLFDYIGDALDRDPSYVRADYDPRTGLPVDVFIDYEAQIADEEMGFRAGQVLPIE